MMHSYYIERHKYVYVYICTVMVFQVLFKDHLAPLLKRTDRKARQNNKRLIRQSIMIK